MALSTPTFIQPLAADHTRDAKIVVVDITFDSSYAGAAGEALNIAQLGLSEVYYASITQKAPLGGTSNTNGQYVFQWDYTNKTIRAYYVDNNNASDGTLIEVPDTTDLSLNTVRAFFYGLSS